MFARCLFYLLTVGSLFVSDCAYEYDDYDNYQDGWDYYNRVNDSTSDTSTTTTTTKTTTEESPWPRREDPPTPWNSWYRTRMTPGQQITSLWESRQRTTPTWYQWHTATTQWNPWYTTTTSQPTTLQPAGNNGIDPKIIYLPLIAILVIIILILVYVVLTREHSGRDSLNFFWNNVKGRFTSNNPDDPTKPSECTKEIEAKYTSKDVDVVINCNETE